MIGIAFWTVLAACLVSCYASACMLAVKSYQRAKLADRLENAGVPERLAFFDDHGDRLQLLAGAVCVIADLSVLLAVLRVLDVHAASASPVIHYGAALFIAVVLVAIWGVAIPSSIARHSSEWLLQLSYQPLRWMHRLLAPVAHALYLFDPIVRRISGADARPEPENAASQDVLNVVQGHAIDGAVDPAQKQMIEAVFDLPTTTAGQIMTPRTEVQAIPANSTLEQVKAALLRHGHSRIPVYDSTIDNIVGILYAKDLLPLVAPADPGPPGPDNATGAPFDLRKYLRDTLMVPESKSVRELLAEFKARKVHIAIVLDEYGGTAGLLTIEDIIEELVGEIHDEFEPTSDAPAFKRIDEHTIDADARVLVHDLNGELGLNIPENEDFDTLGGFVFTTLGHIPESGESFEFNDARFVVTDAARTKVKRVRIELAHEKADAPSANPTAAA